MTASPLGLYFPKRPLIHGGCVSLKGPSYMGLTMYSLVTNRAYAGGGIHIQKFTDKQSRSGRVGHRSLAWIKASPWLPSFLRLSYLTTSTHPFFNGSQWVTRFIAQKPALFPGSYTIGRMASLCLAPSLTNYPEFKYCVWKGSLERIWTQII